MSALAPDRAYIRSVGDEPLPGYRLIAPLGMGGFGEVWKCIAPGGLHKAIKFVSEDRDDHSSTEPTSLQQEYDAFERVKVIRHPFLLTLERVELVAGELVMVMELADQSLGNRYDECRNAGHPGIPRTELLSYMVDAAEALDVLCSQHGLQHLDVKPANLFLLGGHVKVGDYGLVARHKTSLSGEEPKLGRGLTPKYVAPEILFDRVHARSDQYPLALVYMELLTGVFPYPGRTARQLLLQHTSTEPDLSPLPPKDRAAVGKALSKDPAGRFTTCLNFVKALLREDAFDGTKIINATTRTPAAPPAVELKPATPTLITPSIRNSGVARVDSTMRYNPTVANWADPAQSEHAQEFNRSHPGLKYVAEAPSTPRGRVVRVSDASGAPHLVHALKIPPDCEKDCEPVLAALRDSARGAFQVLFRPHSHAFGFAVPESCPTLREFLAKRKAADDPPLRRAEIRAILGPVAAALDSLGADCEFAHGLVSPLTVIQNGNTWGVTLFGLAELLRRTRADQDWMQAELYAAPEAAVGRAEVASDQYSLALLFLELAGAWAPPDRRAQRVDRGSHGFRFNREALLDCESAAVKKAMSIRPESRFRSCAEFLAALEPPVSAGVVLEEVRAVECLDVLSGKPATAAPPPRPERLADALLRSAGALAVAAWPSSTSESLVVKLPDGRLTARFPVKLTAELARLKLTAFKDQHGLELAKWTADTYALKPRAGSPQSLGKGIELVVMLPTGTQAEASELVVTGRPMIAGDRIKTDEQIVLLIEQFRRAVQNTNERRRAARFPTDIPMVAFPINDELAVQAPIAGTCRDVSATGFASLLGGTPTGHAFVTFPTIPEFAKWALLAKVVRSQETRPGQVLFAGRFVHAGT